MLIKPGLRNSFDIKLLNSLATDWIYPHISFYTFFFFQTSGRMETSFFGLLCKLHWLNRRILLTYWVRCETGVHLAFQSNTNFRMQLFLDTIFVIFFIVFLPEMMGIAAEITGNNMKDGTLDFVNKIQILFQFFVWD